MSDEASPNSDDNTESPETIETQYDWSSIAPSTAIVETLALLANCEQHELSLLYDSIDPEAFDAIIAPYPTTATETTASIRFTHTGYTITIESTGTVRISPV